MTFSTFHCQVTPSAFSFQQFHFSITKNYGALAPRALVTTVSAGDPIHPLRFLLNFHILIAGWYPVLISLLCGILHLLWCNCNIAGNWWHRRSKDTHFISNNITNGAFGTRHHTHIPTNCVCWTPCQHCPSLILIVLICCLSLVQPVPALCTRCLCVRRWCRCTAHQNSSALLECQPAPSIMRFDAAEYQIWYRTSTPDGVWR